MPNFVDKNTDAIFFETAFSLNLQFANATQTEYPLEFRCYNASTLIKTIVGKVVTACADNITMNFEYYNFEQLRRGQFTMDLVISLVDNPNKICDDAALWLFHGGRFSVTVNQKAGDAVTILQTPLQDGLGELIFKDGVVRGNSGLHFNLILEQKDENVNLESLETLLNGMLRCIPSCGVPVYFYNGISLPENVDVDQSSISLNCILPLRNCLDGKLFITYCDQSLPGLGKCFIAFDKNPNIWKYLGPVVTHIKAYLPPSNTLLGYSSSSRSYMISEDYGKSRMLLSSEVILDTTLMSDDINVNEVINYSIRNWTCKLLQPIPSSTISDLN
nr:hypothetical protein HmN_000482200 [Hymenolepis microstoma]